MDDAMTIAARLGRLLRDKPWYHRTTVCDRRMEDNGRLATTLEVWGEYEHGQEPEYPKRFGGLYVQFNRVTPNRECPFGSVKATTRSRKLQDAKTK